MLTKKVYRVAPPAVCACPQLCRGTRTSMAADPEQVALSSRGPLMRQVSLYAPRQGCVASGALATCECLELASAICRFLIQYNTIRCQGIHAIQWRSHVSTQDFAESPLHSVSNSIRFAVFEYSICGNIVDLR